MNQSSTIRSTVPLGPFAKENFSTSLLYSFSTENVTVTPEDEILKRLAMYSTYSIIIYIERMRLTFSVINFIIGLPGSVFSFLVILRMKPFTSSSLYFCALAVSDGLFVVFVLLAVYSGLMSAAMADALGPIFEGIWEILTLFPNFILIVLAGERFLAVWLPLKVNVITSVTKAVVCCIVCGLVVLALTAHNFVIWRVDKFDNYVQIGIEGFYDFYLRVWSKVMPFIFYFVPTVLIFVLNIAIISGIRRSNDTRRLMTAGDEKIKSSSVSQSRQVSVMLNSISAIFLVTNIPYAIFHTLGDIGGWRVLNDDLKQIYTYKHAISSFVLTLFTMWRDLNHSLNFLCYFLSTRRFRKELRNLLAFSQKPSHPRNTVRMSTTSSVTGTTRCRLCSSGAGTSPPKQQLQQQQQLETFSAPTVVFS